MTLTYQQQQLLDAATARDAILNLTARHNRCFTEGNLDGWVATFRHRGASFSRDGEQFSDLRAAFDGGGGRRLVAVDHEITVDGINATQRCVAVLYAAGGVSAVGAYQDQLVYERGAWYFASRDLRWS